MSASGFQVQQQQAAVTMMDPRTALPIINVPNHLEASFGYFSGAVIHWIGRVLKVCSSGKDSERLFIVADAASYLCDLAGNVVRCISYRLMRDIVVRDESPRLVGFRFSEEAAGEYDIVVRFNSKEDMVCVTSYLSRIYWAHSGREIKLERVQEGEGSIESRLNLIKPKHWTLRLEPLRQIRFLEKQLNEQYISDQRNDQLIWDEFVRLKKELQAQFETSRNDQYDRMLQQNIVLIAELREKEEELLQLKRVSSRFNGGGSLVVAASGLTLDGGGGSGGGVLCPNCLRMQKILEQHPNIDKVRCHTAETSLVEAITQLDRIREELNPFKKEIQLLRSRVNIAHSLLQDENVSLSERVRGGLKILDPIAVPIVSDDEQNMNNTLSEELKWMKQLVVDASNFHTLELQKLRHEFALYDRHLVEAVKYAIEHHVPQSRVSSSQSAATIVSNARERVVEDRFVGANSSMMRATSQSNNNDAPVSRVNRTESSAR